MITSLSQLDFEKKYSYADYLLWQFKERVELFRGRLFPMTAPNINHQRISGNLYRVISTYLLDKNCEVFHAPIDVRLPLPANRVSEKKIDTVVQPDICVVCDRTKLNKQGCVGAPDLVVEILSPGNSKREMKDKFALYEEAGVLEYWIFDPERQAVFTYSLNVDTQKYQAYPPLTIDDTLKSHVLKGFATELVDIFPEETEELEG